MKEYKNVLGTTKKNTERFSEDLPYNIPIYKRKPYEIKVVERDTASTEGHKTDKYYPYEMEDTRLYQFDKITDCV